MALGSGDLLPGDGLGEEILGWSLDLGFGLDAGLILERLGGLVTRSPIVNAGGIGVAFRFDTEV
jgi:hypothetical protein